MIAVIEINIRHEGEVDHSTATEREEELNHIDLPEGQIADVKYLTIANLSHVRQDDWDTYTSSEDGTC